MGTTAKLTSLARRATDPKRWLRVARKTVKSAPVEWRAQVRRMPVRPELVVYESFAGNGMLCNPEAIFRTLLADPERQHLRHVWVLTDPKAFPETVAEFAGDKRVRFVKRRSFAYWKALATAGHLFNNATFPPEFGKREGQVYVNTWHGTPLKAMGYDEPGGAVGARNVIRNFMMADFLLSTSPFMSEQMYEKAYRLTNVAPGRIVEVGHPRTDRQHLTAAERERLLGSLRASGVRLGDGETVVLYAPTWKGESFHTPLDESAELGERVRELASRLPAGHRVLLKVHQQVYEQARRRPELAPLLVPNHLATNAVLGLTDVLVTDYSSIFFDFLSTGRPVVFFTPDLAEYDGYRGLYLDPDDLPGPRVATAAELADVVSAVGTGTTPDPLVTHAEAYAAARDRFAPLDDGEATQRVVEVVLDGRVEGRVVRQPARDGRQTLLVYLGGMKPNGITASGLNLLHHIDHDRFDVSALYGHATDPARASGVRAIDPRVRHFPRVGGFAPSKSQRRRRRALQTRGTAIPATDLAIMDGLLREEWRRCVGDARFDHIIDWSGYSSFWAFLLTAAPAGSHSIWLHNDLRADQLREVDGRRPHFHNLQATFSAYGRFQHLVSVSPALRDVNAEKLAEFAPAEKFVAARNTINHERVLLKANGLPGAAEALDAAWPGDHVLAVAATDVLEAVESIVAEHGLQEHYDEVERRVAVSSVAPPEPGVRTFVTVGRLSPEKNHKRLVKAFAAVHGEDPLTRLVIIGGGPLLPALTKQVRKLGLEDSVVLAGPQPNPWVIMRECDVFVLSSDYEGQPMVILEARTLGLPVVSTAFSSVASALGPGEGLVVDRKVDALADGMRKALAGGVPNAPFDPVSYNDAVLREFYAAIGADA
ncbi:glycosyltransferase [Phycicoccus sp. 3266]|uniref:glycosyltransferase n=1 Tax=Phycicoccus sp. 3266 TaxID=2817751 RepID=UPI002856C0E0|nr:glycosyltransferase [Phycicoccus sp. 3266]MDR6862281.1 CDP-glycerol glycerophosphotransferase (TagB/SpsB family)/glycosyltransferase involved in cell wall biosynthesis [Phycicoccus sp. 3266]